MTKLWDGKLCNTLWEETMFDLVKSSHIFMDGMSFWRFGISITYSHWCILERMTVFSNCFVITNMTAKKWSKDFFSKWNQIHRKLRIWSHLLNNSLMENFIFVQCIFNLLIFSKVFQICVSNVQISKASLTWLHGLASKLETQILQNLLLKSQKSLPTQVLVHVTKNW